MIQRFIDRYYRPRVEREERKKTEPFLSLCRDARDALERMSKEDGPCPMTQT